VAGTSRRELARSVLSLLFTLWAWTRNGRPRRRFGGRPPAAVYRSDRPTPEQVAQARAWLLELRWRHELARTTRAARNDPVRRQLLAQGLADLGIADPDHRLAASLARYTTDAILHALAAFAAKRQLGTLPPDADPGRYLGGMIRKLNERIEFEHTAGELLRLRIRQRDLTLEPLRRDLARLQTTRDRPQLLQQLVDRALEAVPRVDFRFWIRAIKDLIPGLGRGTAAKLYPHLARRVAASFATDRDRRADLLRTLAYATGDAEESA